tara:strand:- start:147 stop:326 length:180 start_codon:yes stop_codon:yes gene_type:complete
LDLKLSADLFAPSGLFIFTKFTHPNTLIQKQNFASHIIRNIFDLPEDVLASNTSDFKIF